MHGVWYHWWSLPQNPEVSQRLFIRLLLRKLMRAVLLLQAWHGCTRAVTSHNWLNISKWNFYYCHYSINYVWLVAVTTNYYITWTNKNIPNPVYKQGNSVYPYLGTCSRMPGLLSHVYAQIKALIVVLNMKTFSTHCLHSKLTNYWQLLMYKRVLWKQIITCRAPLVICKLCSANFYLKAQFAY